MHVTKFSQGACGHMINHYEREEGDGVTRSNEEIVPELTHLNYNLAAEDQPKAGYQFLSERLEEVHHMNRKDIIVMADWVITAPEEIKDDPEKCRQFFECSYEFMKQKYSKASIISAWVHMDETTPHLHFAFMPIVKDEKHGGMKLGAKQLINRVELKKIHNQLQKKIDKELPFECKVLNGATKLGNRSVEELKEVTKQAETIVARAEESASNTISVAQTKADAIEMKAKNKATTVLAEADGKAKEIRHQANEYEKESRLRAKNRAESILQSAEASANNVVADATMRADSIIDNAENEATEIIAKAKKESTFWERAYHELADWVDQHFEKVLALVLGKWWNWDKEDISEGLRDLKEAWNMKDEDLEQELFDHEQEIDDDYDLW